MIDTVIIGALEFQRDGNEMFINRLVTPGEPDGDGDHIATADGVWDDVWNSFLQALRNGEVQFRGAP